MPGARSLPLTSAAALALPVLAGIGWMGAGGAPLAWLAVNGAALVLALALACWLPLRLSERGTLILGAALVLTLWATALFGIQVEGVRRWVGIGPVRLHLGYLVLPLLVVLAARLPSPPAAALLAAALAATVLQPDLAATVALAASIITAALQRRGDIARVLAGISLGACGYLLGQVDPLTPVRFVEHVQSDAWAMYPVIGAALTLLALSPLLLLRTAPPLAAFLVVAGAMAFAGPYPSILIGYGAAPILGFGLALAALRCQSGRR